MAQIGNGEGLNAALGAAASQLASGKVEEFSRNLAGGLSDDPVTKEILANLISNAVSGGLGYAAGGESGANLASNMDRYNRQLHPAEIKWIKDNANEFALQQGISYEEAVAQLSQQAARQVDALWNVLLGGQTDTAAAEFLNKGSESATFSAFGGTYTSPLFKADDSFYRAYGVFFNSEDSQFYEQYVKKGRISQEEIDAITTVLADQYNEIWESGKAIAKLATTDGFIDAIKKFEWSDIFDAANDFNAGLYTMLDMGESALESDELIQRYGTDSIAILQSHDIIFNALMAGAASIAGKVKIGQIGSRTPSIPNPAQQYKVLEYKGEYYVADTGIPWGKGIQSQGLTWEDYLAKQLPDEARLPKNFKAFDFFDTKTKTAISAKTLDTTTAAKVSNPKQIYSSLVRNIDDAANFENYRLSGVSLNASNIKIREVHVAVPQGTTKAQWDQIKRAQDYALQQNVVLKVTAVK